MTASIRLILCTTLELTGWLYAYGFGTNLNSSLASFRLAGIYNHCITSLRNETGARQRESSEIGGQRLSSWQQFEQVSSHAIPGHNSWFLGDESDYDVIDMCR